MEINSQVSNKGHDEIARIKQVAKKKSSDIECEVSGALALTLRASRIFGLAPLHFHNLQDGRWRVRLSPTLCIFNKFLVTVINILILCGFLFDTLTPARDSVFMRELSSGLISATEMMVTSFITSCGVYLSKQWIIMMMQTLHHLDKLNLISCNGGDTRQWIKYAYVIFGFLALVALVLLIVHNHVAFLINTMRAFHTYFYILHCLELVRSYWLQAQCIFIVLAMSEALSTINKMLSQVLNKMSASAVNNDNMTGTPETIRRAYVSFCLVCDLMSQFQHTSGPLLFTFMIFYFTRLTFAFYRFISVINCPLPVLYFITSSTGIIHMFVSMVLLIEPCHRTRKQVVKMRVLVSRLMSREWMSRGRVGAQLELFHQQLTVSRLTITPLDMFTLNRALIVTILGAITTYLVIVVQFQGNKLCNIFISE